VTNIPTAVEFFSPCDLHFPHKGWSDDPRESENYAAIERWAFFFRRNCLGKGGVPAPPLTPIIVDVRMDANTTTTYSSTEQAVTFLLPPSNEYGVPSTTTQQLTQARIPPGHYNQIAATFYFKENSSSTAPVNLRHLALQVRGMPGNVPLFFGQHDVTGQHNQILRGFVQALNLNIAASYSYAAVTILAQFGNIFGLPCTADRGSGLLALGTRTP
jgi:hypothetical protein